MFRAMCHVLDVQNDVLRLRRHYDSPSVDHVPRWLRKIM